MLRTRRSFVWIGLLLVGTGTIALLAYYFGFFWFSPIEYDISYSKYSNRTKILIGSVHESGGHKSASNALRDSLESRGYAVDIYYNDRSKQGLTYYESSAAARGGELGRFLHNNYIHYLICLWALRKQGAPHAAKIRELLDENNYACFISVSPFIASCIDRINCKIPAFIIPTDLENRGVWLDSRTANYILASSRLAEQARESGISNDHMQRISMMPLHPKFIHAIKPKSERKKQLGLSGGPMVLVLFGSCGSYEMADIMEQVKHDTKRNYVFICGKNKKLYEYLCKLNKEKYHHRYDVRGFTKNIHHWMQASDVLLGKPGPGVITECIVSKLPIIVSKKGVMWQEAYNMQYILDHKIGKVISYWDDGLLEAIDSAADLQDGFKEFDGIDPMQEICEIIEPRLLI